MEKEKNEKTQKKEKTKQKVMHGWSQCALFFKLSLFAHINHTIINPYNLSTRSDLAGRDLLRLLTNRKDQEPKTKASTSLADLTSITK